MITYRLERWVEFYPDAKELFPRHWRELALNQDTIPIDYDRERYQQLDDAGVLMILAARKGRELVGYLMCFLMPHLHYKSSGPMALTDMYYVVPEMRVGVGAKLFLEWERILRERSICQAITSCKVHQDHSEFFNRLGWTHSDNTFVKYLGAKACP